MAQNSTLKNLFSSGASIFYPVIEECQYPWDALARLEDFILEKIEELRRDPLALGEEFVEISEGVFAARSARIAKSALIEPPCLIFPNAEIRHCAYLRGRVIVGGGAVVGNSSEVKGSVLFDRAALPHFNYVGDSILGMGAHLGAGAITSNLRLDKAEVKVRTDGEVIPTGRRKLGALVGDGAEIGCGSVLCPGSIIGSNATVMPLCSVSGTVERDERYSERHEKGGTI